MRYRFDGPGDSLDLRDGSEPVPLGQTFEATEERAAELRFSGLDVWSEPDATGDGQSTDEEDS